MKLPERWTSLGTIALALMGTSSELDCLRVWSKGKSSYSIPAMYTSTAHHVHMHVSDHDKGRRKEELSSKCKFSGV